MFFLVVVNDFAIAGEYGDSDGGDGGGGHVPGSRAQEAVWRVPRHLPSYTHNCLHPKIGTALPAATPRRPVHRLHGQTSRPGELFTNCLHSYLRVGFLLHSFPLLHFLLPITMWATQEQP